MTDRELFEKALEALEFHSCGDEIDEALIVALRKRLAQPEQEPFAWVDESAIRWLADRKGKTSAHCTTQLSAARSCEQPMPIYTAPPPQRQWVGLTDDEMHECWDSPLTPLGMKHARMIEAKLREKNA